DRLAALGLCRDSVPRHAAEQRPCTGNLGSAEDPTREDAMKRRTVLKGALAAGAALAMPSYLRAQSSKKISILTWNIADQEALFKEEFADFQKQNPGVEIEWLDKKGPEVPVFYQTQLVAGTPPDIINTQGA